MIKEPNHLPKKAPKRFVYSVEAFVEFNKSRQPIQIHDISKTGVQFFSNVALPMHTQVRMMWKDAQIGNMESYLEIVRSVEQHEETSYEYCYGSKFVHLKDEARRNLNRVVETTEEHERMVFEKKLDNVPFKTINDVITHGRMFLRDILRGNKSSGVIDQFAKEMKDYEKHCFDSNDEQSQWLQKIVTQNFHARILMVILGSKVRLSDVQKLITDKIQSIDCLVDECEKYMKANMITKKTPGGLHESLNRLIYARVELSDTFHKRSNIQVGTR